MKAVVMRGPHRLAVEEIADPRPEGRALVAVETGGLCGTDLKILSGAIPVRCPLVMGHEVVGRVVKAGELGLVVEGTRVLVDPGLACRWCRPCRADRPNLCPNGALMGRDVDGGFAELVAVDELQLHPIPEHLPVAEAALLQVLATCVHAQTLVDVFPGDPAAVMGLGVSGLLHLQLLRARGAGTILGITRSAWKRQLALELGATAVAAPEEAAEVARQLGDGARPRLVVESVGEPETLGRCVELAAPGGTILAFGTVTADQVSGFPFYELYYKELELVSSRAARPRDYARAVELVAQGTLRLAPLWSRSFPLAEARRAFEVLMDAGSADLKVTLENDPVLA
ncbi:MAG: zinc-dependent alcohol dehydrogenase [Acidimicrobiia bacterium]